MADLKVILSRLSQLREELARLERELGETPRDSCAQLLPILHEVSSRSGQQSILEACLDGVAVLADRAVLFLERGGALEAWRWVGFPDPPAAIALASAGERLGQALAERACLVSTPEGEWPEELPLPGATSRAAFLPLVFADEAPLFLYVEKAETLPLDALELLCQVTALVLKNDWLHGLLAGQKKPVPAGHGEETLPVLERPAEPSSPEAEEPPQAAAGTEEPTVPPPRTAALPTRAASEPTRDPAAQARRLSRILVSEIKLYHAEEIQQGRRNQDLYNRLRAPIESRRQRYQEQVDTLVARQRDYYHEELVHILAAGDPQKMGPDYPGACLLEKQDS